MTLDDVAKIIVDELVRQSNDGGMVGKDTSDPERIELDGIFDIVQVAATVIARLGR